MTELSPAERFAALRTLKDAIARVEANLTAWIIANPEGADRWRTRFGTVTVAHPKPKPAIISDAELVDYCREHHPEEVIEVVRPTFLKVLKDRLVVVGDDVVDPATGEVVPWAMVKQGNPYLSTPTSDEKKAAIDLWEELIEAKLLLENAVGPTELGA